MTTTVTRSLVGWVACLLTFGLLGSASAQEVRLSDRLATQKFLLEHFEDVYGKRDYVRNVFDHDFAHPRTFSKRLKELPSKPAKRARALIRALDPYFPAKILMPLIYWRIVEPNPARLEGVLGFHVLNRLVILRDFIDHPLQGTPEEKARALAYLRELTGASGLDTLNLMGASKAARARSASLAQIADDLAFVRAIQADRLISEDLRQRVSLVSDFSNGWLGFVPGNQVELISQNDVSKRRMDWLNERMIFAGGRLDFTAPYMELANHEVFQDPVFRKIREMVDQAKESIFIDIFLFGGTMGGALAKYVIDKTLEKRAVNPAFKTLFLHDYATNYNMKDEMMPVFEYMRDRIVNEPEVAESFLLLQANIQRHPPGIPFGVTLLVPKTDEVMAAMERKNTFFESKIDHSKVIVIDANGEAPEAYFGSKNWSDHSGAYYYDDALWVRGPAAALVQAAYLDDVAAALTTDPLERRRMYFEEEGLTNERYLPRREAILEWMRVKRVSYPPLGTEPVRLAEANVDGHIADARNLLIEMIRSAEKNIYMEQLFIYDKYVNDALMKRKLQRPALDVRIIADPNGNFGFDGFPNTMFMKELQSYGVKVKTRKILGFPAKLPNGEDREFHQEDHRKITSVDGKVLMVGSSNQNPDTFQGSFREFGAQVFDVKEVAKFEERFRRDWDDPDQSVTVDMENFRMTIGGESLSPEASGLMNDLGSTIIRGKDDLEGRY